MGYKELADLIFPDVKEVSYYEEKYPERDLKDGAIVTRFAPSPTGFTHIGGLYQSLVAKKMANQTEGVFFVRIEDTDQKRELENAVADILNSLEEIDENDFSKIVVKIKIKTKLEDKSDCISTKNVRIKRKA